MRRLNIWFASILKRLASRVASEDVENEDQQSRRERDKPNEARHAPITRTTIDIPEFILDEYRESRKTEDANERKHRTIAWSAVVAASALAVIGMWQASLTRKANRASQKAFQLSERAWVGVTSVRDGEPEVQKMINGKTVPTNVNVDLTLQNFGKSPAITAAEFTPVLWPFGGKDDFDRESQTACTIATWSFQRKRTQIIFPSETIANRVRASMAIDNQPAADGNRYLYIIGCVIYSDSLTTCDPSKANLSNCRVTRYCAQSAIEPQTDWAQPIHTVRFEFCPMLNDMYH